MTLPATVYNHYLRLNEKITWSKKEIGAIKGILSYYYGRDWVSVGEIYIVSLLTLFGRNLLTFHDHKYCSFSLSGESSPGQGFSLPVKLFLND